MNIYNFYFYQYIIILNSLLKRYNRTFTRNKILFPLSGGGAPVHQRREDRQLLEHGGRGAGAEFGGDGRHRRRWVD